MTKPHLRPQTGGDPAQGPSDDLANKPAAPASGNDFPDAPEQSSDSDPQDKPDLDAFAKRLGTDTINTGDGLGAVPEDRTDPASGSDSRLIIGGLGAAFALLFVVVLRRRRQHGILAKAAALGAAAHAVRS